ncbi:lysozyme inhibitor LprI family protein [Bosea caraganae]|nr:lysozyme inhibitor LprI family protein [Bosea caraganae]
MMMKSASALLFALVATAPALAQTPPVPNPTLAVDRAQMASCLRQSSTATGACVGLIAVTCVRAVTGDRRDAETTCARREEAVWRERLELASLAVMRATDSGSRGQFASLQLAWEGYVAQKCAFYGSTQPVARAAGMQAGCELREVANRSLELERAITQRAASQRRPSNNPPQIIR